MASAYSMDLRERVAAARDAGLTTKHVAERFSVCCSWVRRLMQRRRETGSLMPRTGKRGPTPKLDPHRETLRKLVDKKSDSTLEELRDALPLRVCVATVWTTLRRMGITLKKSDSRIRATAA